MTLGFDLARFQTKPLACHRAAWQLAGPDIHRQATTSLQTRSTVPSRLHLRLYRAHEMGSVWPTSIPVVASPGTVISG